MYRNLFHEIKAGFTGVYPIGTDITKEKEAVIEHNGGSIQKETTNDNLDQITHLFSYDFRNSSKMKKARS